MQTLLNKVAVITGAASGIGLACARTLSRRGAHVVAVDLNANADTAADITSHGTAAMAHAADVCRPDAFEVVSNLVLQRFGRVDIVMNNVGVLTNGLPEHIPFSEWQRIIDTNLMSVVRSNDVFLPLLLDQGEGHIVNTSSFAGLFTYSYDRMPYAATKAAIVQITEALAIYLRPKNIGVTLLCPGPVVTNIANNVPRFGSGAPLRLPPAKTSLRSPATMCPAPEATPRPTERIPCDLTLFLERFFPTMSFLTIPRNGGNFPNCKDNTPWFSSSAAEGIALKTDGRRKGLCNSIGNSKLPIAAS